MEVTRLTLRNFRCYKRVEVPLSQGINLIHGKNGSGKTTIAEALYLLSTGRSFLTPHLTHLIRKGESYFYVEATFTRDGVEQALGIGLDGKNRRIYYNNTALQSLSSLLGILPSVLYSPRDHTLIMGAPQERRRFINIQIAQTSPLYVYHLTRYHKAMKQRNALLKIKSTKAIESWEQMMGESGRFLMHKRSELIEHLRPKVTTFAAQLSKGADFFDLRYSPSIPLKRIKEIENVLEKNRQKELIIGSTTAGPHRDDFQIMRAQMEAKSFASEGQKRTCIAALKMAEWEVLKEKAKTVPLLAIDDFGTHLDPERTELLREALTNFGQVLLTSPTPFTEGLQIEAGRVLAPFH